MIEIEMGPKSDITAVRQVEAKIQYLCDSLVGKKILGTKRLDGSQKKYEGEEISVHISYIFHRLEKHIIQKDFEDDGPLKVFNVILRADHSFMFGITDSPESGKLRTQTAQLFREFIKAYYGKSV